METDVTNIEVVQRKRTLRDWSDKMKDFYNKITKHGKFSGIVIAGGVLLIALIAFLILLTATPPSTAQAMGAEFQFEPDTTLVSRLEIYSLESGERTVIYEAEDHFEAPNWSRDGEYLIFNSNGRLYTISEDGGGFLPTVKCWPSAIRLREAVQEFMCCRLRAAIPDWWLEKNRHTGTAGLRMEKRWPT